MESSVGVVSQRDRHFRSTLDCGCGSGPDCRAIFWGVFRSSVQEGNARHRSTEEGWWDYRCSQSYARCRWSSRPWRYRRNKSPNSSRVRRTYGEEEKDAVSGCKPGERLTVHLSRTEPSGSLFPAPARRSVDARPLDREVCLVEVYPSLTPYKRRLQAGHAGGWGLGGPHTDDGDQLPQIPNSGSNPLEWTSNGPGSNLEGGATRGAGHNVLGCSVSRCPKSDSRPTMYS